MQKTSSAGIALIKQFEGERLTAYICPAGILTIGVGHTGADVKPGQKITVAESEALLRADLARFEKAVSAAVKVPLNQNQFDALVALAFNIGAGAFAGSTLVRLLNGKDYAGAAAQFERWNKGGGKVLPGLVARRAAEAALFRKPA
ncbi:lysozyme [Sphingomonas sp. R1]|uniref:lysozyme n=1 Tax=Sphingomonas sp. R1 TaxID=399176 RepID=UPI002224ADE4|nr:lysozyme [Sphingomonas sp. R1]UYY77475.1 lysozyme [Sphingomonas sp. R1]